MKDKIEQFILLILLIFSPVVGGKYAGEVIIKNFNKDHSYIVIQENDADYIREQTQKKIWGK